MSQRRRARDLARRRSLRQVRRFFRSKAEARQQVADPGRGSAGSGTVDVRKRQARSQERIIRGDLVRLAELAEADLADLFERKPDLARLYRDRVLCVALCQGAALHYLDGRNGVKDFDVWTFFAAHAERPFPYRRRAEWDFGPSKFGRSPGAPSRFTGRRVDMLGRSLHEPPDADPVEAIRRYLAAARTSSARLLAEKAVVLVSPEPLRGKVAWPADAKRRLRAEAPGWLG